VCINVSENIKSRPTGHEKIENNAGWGRPRSRDGVECLAVTERRYLVAFGAEHLIEKIADYWLVIDDEYFGVTGHYNCCRVRTRVPIGFIEHNWSPVSYAQQEAA
jgi:hypothetical protein